MSVRGEKLEIQWVCQKPSGNRTEISLDSNVDDGQTFALRVGIKYSKNGLPGTKNLTINSPHLLKILKSIVVSHPSVLNDSESPFEIEEPYLVLYHNWDKILAVYERVALRTTSECTSSFCLSS